ncbi:MAG: periplasmic heavy metal sensor [Candidatus Omnitrophota bacterium]
MKRSLKRAGACVLAGMLVFTAVDAQAWYGDGKKSHKRAEKMERFAEELGLSDQQKEAIEANKKAAEENAAIIKQDLYASKQALSEELKKPEIDPAAVNKAALGIKDAQGKFVDARVESFLAMKEVLTEEQFRKMIEMKDSWSGKKGKRSRDRAKKKGNDKI